LPFFRNQGDGDARDLSPGSTGAHAQECVSRRSTSRAKLPKGAFAGAINVPFDQAFDDHIQSAVSDKTVPVIVYCADVNCQLSPQAAERLDRLGYTKVFDYKAGKADWQKAKLQVESS
jgi:rhodanese-related sulfurtransferase